MVLPNKSINFAPMALDSLRSPLRASLYGNQNGGVVIIYYHGTTIKDLEKFKIGLGGGETTELTNGIWLSTNFLVAERMAKKLTEDNCQDGYVYKVELLDDTVIMNTTTLELPNDIFLKYKEILGYFDRHITKNDGWLYNFRKPHLNKGLSVEAIRNEVISTCLKIGIDAQINPLGVVNDDKTVNAYEESIEDSTLLLLNVLKTKSITLYKTV